MEYFIPCGIGLLRGSEKGHDEREREHASFLGSYSHLARGGGGSSYVSSRFSKKRLHGGGKFLSIKCEMALRHEQRFFFYSAAVAAVREDKREPRLHGLEQLDDLIHVDQCMVCR